MSKSKTLNATVGKVTVVFNLFAQYIIEWRRAKWGIRHSGSCLFTKREQDKLVSIVINAFSPYCLLAFADALCTICFILYSLKPQYPLHAKRHINYAMSPSLWVTIKIHNSNGFHIRIYSAVHVCLFLLFVVYGLSNNCRSFKTRKYCQILRIIFWR